MPIETITQEEAHRRMRAQSVSAREHIAFVCPMCATVQSMASLIAAGCREDMAERHIGFACEGRFRDAGPWPTKTANTVKARARRLVRGCDWSLGGLFKLHKLEVVDPDGKHHPSFVIASPEDARALERMMTAAAGDQAPRSSGLLTSQRQAVSS